MRYFDRVLKNIRVLGFAFMYSIFEVWILAILLIVPFMIFSNQEITFNYFLVLLSIVELIHVVYFSSSITLHFISVNRKNDFLRINGLNDKELGKEIGGYLSGF